MIGIVTSMVLIEMTGHAIMKFQTMSIMDKYVGLNEAEFALKNKKTMDDYLS